MKPHPFLRPLAILYGLGASIDRFLKRRKAVSFSVPVVSVGGITAGGSGKTPVTRELLIQLSNDYDVILLSRGYGRSGTEPIVWHAGDPIPLAEIMGDEPVLIARSMTRGVIAVGADRVSTLKSVVNAMPSTAKPIAVLDDGFQHYRLKRDLDIVIVDDRTTTERYLLPAGYLREKPASLERADILLATSTAAAEYAERLKGSQARVYRLEFVPGSVNHWKTGKERVTERLSVLLVTGIAQPERVRRSSEAVGINIVDELQFKDHHRYSSGDVQHIIKRLEQTGTEVLLTTEKDAVKLEMYPELERSLHVLTLQIRFPLINDLLKLIDLQARSI